MSQEQSQTSLESVVIAHMQRYLGTVSEGWQPGGSEGEETGIALVQWDERPDEDHVIVSTFGLSRLPLFQGEGAELRQEFLIVWPEEELTDSVLSHLYAAAQTMATTGEAFPRGGLLPLPQTPPLPSGTDEPLVAWYATVPYFMPREGVLLEAVEPPLVLTWLLPVYENELQFITLSGAEAFEDLIVEAREKSFVWPRESLVES